MSAMGSMGYQQIGYQQMQALLFAIYMVALGIAYLLSYHARNKWEQVAAYAATIFVFQIMVAVIPELSPAHLHFWWYLLNAGVDAYIFALAWKLGAPASIWIMRIAVAATVLDLAFFIAAGTGNRLPGPWYFVGSSVCESLQILSMILLSGPVMPVVRTPFQAIARRLTWLWTWLWKHEEIIEHT